MIKITKKKHITEVRGHIYGDKIEEMWPRFRRKMSLIEYVTLARKTRISEDEIQFTLWKFDVSGWLEAQKGFSLARGEHKQIVDGYLNEQVERN